MPELPEIETICRGIAPLIIGSIVERVVVRESRLRVAVPLELSTALAGRRVIEVSRRAKYLLIRFDAERTLLVHLGMSGSLRVLPSTAHAERHDHVDLLFTDGKLLRLRDPRRFGALLLGGGEPLLHPALAGLGPEPLSDDFNADVLFARSRGRSLAVKAFLMDQRTVVGVGNIYASEALFLAGIAPDAPAGTISRVRYRRLVVEVRAVLARAIAAGGTTLRDFQNAEGKPGYFAQQLLVYGREGEKCPACRTPIKSARIGGRSSFFCPRCQR